MRLSEDTHHMMPPRHPRQRGGIVWNAREFVGERQNGDEGHLQLVEDGGCSDEEAQEEAQAGGQR